MKDLLAGALSLDVGFKLMGATIAPAESGLGLPKMKIYNSKEMFKKHGNKTVLDVKSGLFQKHSISDVHIHLLNFSPMKFWPFFKRELSSAQAS